MLTTLAAQNWGMFVLRGILALALGVLAFAAPGPTLAALIFVFAVYAIVDGILRHGARPRGPADPAGCSSSAASSASPSASTPSSARRSRPWPWSC